MIYGRACGAIVERGAPATAIHVRDILKQIYGFAILHGEKVANPRTASARLDRDLRAEGSVTLTHRNQGHAQAA